MISPTGWNDEVGEVMDPMIEALNTQEQAIADMQHEAYHAEGVVKMIVDLAEKVDDVVHDLASHFHGGPNTTARFQTITPKSDEPIEPIMGQLPDAPEPVISRLMPTSTKKITISHVKRVKGKSHIVLPPDAPESEPGEHPPWGDSNALREWAENKAEIDRLKDELKDVQNKYESSAESYTQLLDDVGEPLKALERLKEKLSDAEYRYETVSGALDTTIEELDEAQSKIDRLKALVKDYEVGERAEIVGLKADIERYLNRYWLE